MTSAVEGRLVPLAQGLDRLIQVLSQALIYITTAVLLTALALNVLFRYALPGAGIGWLSELPEHLFPWMVAAGVVLAAQHNAHIAVDFIIHLAGDRYGRVMLIAVQLVIVLTYTLFVVVAWNMSQIVSVERSALLGLSRSYAFYALVFMGAGLLLTALSLALRIGIYGRDAIPQADPEESVT